MIKIYQIVVDMKDSETSISDLKVAQYSGGILTFPQLNSENCFFQVSDILRDEESGEQYGLVMIAQSRGEMNTEDAMQKMEALFSTENISISPIDITDDDGNAVEIEDPDDEIQEARDALSEGIVSEIEHKIRQRIKADGAVQVQSFKSGSTPDDEKYVCYVARTFGGKKDMVTKNPPGSGDFIGISIREGSLLDGRLDSTFLYYAILNAYNTFNFENNYIGSTGIRHVKLRDVKDLAVNAIARISITEMLKRSSISPEVMYKLSRLDSFLRKEASVGIFSHKNIRSI